MWWNETLERKRPILIVCYTNHALDQFLERIIDKCSLQDGIVRIGGRCKSSLLEPFLLKNLKKNTKSKSRSIFYRVKEIEDELRSLSIHLNLNSNSIKQSYNGILTIKCLFHKIDKMYLNQLLNNTSSDDKIDYLQLIYTLLQWLGFYSLKYYPKSEFIDENLDENEYEEFQIQENIDELDRRMLDNDFDDINPLSEEVKYFNDSNAQNLTNLHVLSSSVIHSLLKDVCPNNLPKIKEVEAHINKIENTLIHRNEPSEKDIWSISLEERFQLYNKWVLAYRLEFKKEIDLNQEFYNRKVDDLRILRMQNDRLIMQEALILAMTTTGSARYHSILKDIKPRIVIVEEAAEVFETHVISALSKDCEHLILIGDHIQLRPNPTMFTLAKDYQIDVSLFERLLNNNIKKVMLNCQHRMRPEISLLMKHFYDKNIYNDISVSKFPNINGIEKCVFFIKHAHLEQVKGTSKTNKHEADYLSKLSYYLTEKGYKQSDITVITMYLGQTFEIKKSLSKNGLKDIRVTTVDNFQGEESKIILLSLVRSNLNKKIGFVGIENRICVALSRAKHGLYCIGNFEMFSHSNSKWNEICKTLEENHAIGSYLSLFNCKHEQMNTMAKEPKDFDLALGIKCKLLCNFDYIDCMHKCNRICHNYDPEHKSELCNMPCDKKIKICGHMCKIKCGHQLLCESFCEQIVEKKISQCGHLIKFKCNKIPTSKDCGLQCVKILSCGHRCTQPCSISPCPPCNVNIFVDLCLHIKEFKVKCSLKENAFELKSCNKPCDLVSSCGHLCKNQCGHHLPCASLCEDIAKKKIIECGHLIDFKCNLIPTIKNCELQCVKKLSCGHRCNFLCKDLPCPSQSCNTVINIDSKCRHKDDKTRVICSDEIWTHQTACKQICNQLLKCGHWCKNECGQCYGGRLHVICNEKCDKPLVCGHKCLLSCDQPCKSCELKCENKCPHSRCNLKCGEACIKCKLNKVIFKII